MADGRNKVPALTVVDFDKLLFLPQLQCRDRLNQERIENISIAIKSGEEIDRLEVWELEGEVNEQYQGYLVTDGWHRGMAYDKAGRKKAIPVTIYKGSMEEVMRASASANKKHDNSGMPRSNADKERGLMLYAKSYESLPKKDWPSNEEAANFVGCSKSFVKNLDPFGRGKGATGGVENRRKKTKKGHKSKGARANGKKPENAPLPSETAEKTAYDFNAVIGQCKWLVKALENLCDTFAVSEIGGRHTLKKAEDGFNVFIEFMEDAKAKFGRRKESDKERGEVDENGFPVSYSLTEGEKEK